MNFSDISTTIQANLWSDVNLFSKLETLCLAAPLFIWGAGATEGAIKTSFKAIKIAIHALQGTSTEEELSQLKNQWSITRGCGTLAAISLIPLSLKLIPYPLFFMVRGPIEIFALEKTGKPISVQVTNYKQIRKALSKAKKRLEEQEEARRIQEIAKISDPEALQQNFKISKNETPEVTIEDLDECERKLNGTLINHNWSYTIAFRSVELVAKTAKRVLFSGRLLNGFKFILNAVGEEIDSSVERQPLRS